MTLHDIRTVILPPFVRYAFSADPELFLVQVVNSPHPTDLLLDSSVFSPVRIPRVRQILRFCSPILLASVVEELEDLKAKPALADLCNVVFPGGVLNTRFRGDEHNVLKSYPRFSLRYANLLQWRKNIIDVWVRKIEQETGNRPAGKSRARLIRDLVGAGMASETVMLANKEYRPERLADEFVADPLLFSRCRIISWRRPAM